MGTNTSNNVKTNTGSVKNKENTVSVSKKKKKKKKNVAVNKNNNSSVNKKSTLNNQTTNKKTVNDNSKVNKNTTVNDSKKKNTTVNNNSKNNVKDGNNKNVTIKDSSKKNTGTVNNTNSKSKKKNKSKNKINNNSNNKANTYQYNKRNLDKNKSDDLKKEELLIDNSLKLDNTKEEVKTEVDNDNKVLMEQIDFTDFLDNKEESNIIEDNKEDEKLFVHNEDDTNTNEHYQDDDFNYLDYTFEEEKLNKLRDEIYSLYESNIKTTFDENDDSKIVEEIIDDEEVFEEKTEEVIEEESEESFEEKTEEEFEKSLSDDKFEKTVNLLDNNLCLVDNILTEETKNNIEFTDFSNDKVLEYNFYKVLMVDIIIGLLLFVFTVLSIMTVWFMVFLITY